MTINIRMARLEDIGRLMEIFEVARQFMQSVGNSRQWVNGYPQNELIEQEIRNAHCYVCEDEQAHIVGTFCFIPGPDPTYARIDDGQWLNEEPYYVIHRLASDGTYKGLAKACIDWCGNHTRNLRVDTHEDNRIMQHLLEKNGFVRCGIIYVANGTSRIAYQRIQS